MLKIWIIFFLSYFFFSIECKSEYGPSFLICCVLHKYRPGKWTNNSTHWSWAQCNPKDITVLLHIVCVCVVSQWDRKSKTDNWKEEVTVLPAGFSGNFRYQNLFDHSISQFPIFYRAVQNNHPVLFWCIPDFKVKCFVSWNVMRVKWYTHGTNVTNSFQKA